MMGQPVDTPAIGEPSRWLLIFNWRAAGRWQGLIAVGRFKHVRAMGYVPGVKHWVCYDVTFRRTQIAVVRDRSDEFRALFNEWTHEAEVMWIDAKPAHKARLPAVFLCTTAIKHLIGLRSSALLPSTLYRHCLSNGGTVIDGRAQEAGPAAAQPAV